MEKKTVVLVIGGLFVLALAFILMAIFVSEHKLKQKQFVLPDFLNSSNCPKDFDPFPLILVSLDGFRPGYMSRLMNPVLRHLIDKGSSAPYMSTSYPSITFPNHYSIVTGLYPESHGIINNIFYDKASESLFSYKTNAHRDRRYWHGEPIWNTVEKKGYKSATYFWPGSEADIGGFRPTYFKKFDSSVPLIERVDQVLQWLSLPKEDRPIFISLYSNQPDKAGHSYGPVSGEVDRNLTIVDNMVKHLILGLKERGILECVNIIFVSDHGMSSGGPSKIIDLANNLGNLSDAVFFQQGASAGLSLEDKFKDQEPQLKRSLSCKQKKVRVYKKDEVPLRLHFSRNPNIHDYVLLAKDGFRINLNSDFYLNGLHGYDSHAKSMNAFFFAYGPAFKMEYRTEPFQNIELYNLMCHLLDLPSAPNNGTDGRLFDILIKPPSHTPIKEKELPALLDLNPKRYRGSNCSGDNETYKFFQENLDFEEDNIEDLTEDLLPWGPPQRENKSLDISLLYHLSHITGYSKSLKIPMWSSFVIDSIPVKDTDYQWMSDPRIPIIEAPSCPELQNKYANDTSEIILSPLYHPDLSKNELDKKMSYLVTNALPFSKEAFSNWEQYLLKTLPRRLKFSESSIHIVVGPVFDANSDGLDDRSQNFDTLESELPSDYFAIATRCNSKVNNIKDCAPHHLDSMGFVLPRKMTIKNCLSTEELALEYTAKVRDIELVTGLQFFPKILPAQRLKTILRERQELWPLEKVTSKLHI